MTENEIAKLAVDICFKIHDRNGPGLFETVFEEIFCYEWTKTSISFRRQQAIPVIHEEIKLEIGFRQVTIIDNKVIIEFKSVEPLAPVQYKQVKNYLRLTGIKLGLLINFNVPLIKDGIHRIVNNI